MIYAQMEHGDEGQPTGRILIKVARPVVGRARAQVAEVVATLEVGQAAHLVGDIAQCIENIQRAREGDQRR